MSFFLFHIKRIFLAPFAWFRASNALSDGVSRNPERSRALWLGLPAMVLAIVGVSLLLWAKYGMSATLENRYLVQVEKSGLEKRRVAKDLSTELRMIRNAQQALPESERKSQDELIPKDDPRRMKYDRLLDEEEVYWNKLIDLNQQEPEYKYQLARISLEKNKPQRGLALMNLTAPLGEPGFAEAHLWLANFHWRSALQRDISKDEARRNVVLALRHLDQCLRRDRNNVSAKKNKAEILFRLKRYAAAYPFYEELYQDDVNLVARMVDINRILGRPEESVVVVRDAVGRYQQLLKDPAISEEDWNNYWTALRNCYRTIGDFKTIEGLLQEEIGNQVASAQQSEQVGSVRLVFLKELLASVYLGWIDQQRGKESLQSRFEKAEKAYENDPTSELVLLELTRLGVEPVPPETGSEPLSDSAQSDLEEQQRLYREKLDISKLARGHYDANKDKDASAVVQNELGTQALSRKQYQKAIGYFESAISKAPRSPHMLNNLAYTYLVCEKKNPARALSLVDRALANFNPTSDQMRKRLSNFRDTRGLAMMQLNRLDEAAAEFEIALADRPNNVRILKNLVKCYDDNGLDSSSWQERLDQLKKKPDSE